MDQIEFLELSDVMQIHIDQIANYGGAIDMTRLDFLIVLRNPTSLSYEV